MNISLSQPLMITSIPKPDPMVFEDSENISNAHSGEKDDFLALLQVSQGQVGDSPQNSPFTYPLSDNAFHNERNIMHLSPDGLEVLLKDPMSHRYSQVVIFDVRFRYEFMGGRIVGAKNITRFSDLIDFYWKHRDQNYCVVFHCEFSSERGPLVANLFRNFDRSKNNYPHLSFPHVYILDGGFNRFYREKKDSGLITGRYVAMRDPKYVANGELRKSNTAFIKEFKQPHAQTLCRRVSKSCGKLAEKFDGIEIDLSFSASQ